MPDGEVASGEGVPDGEVAPGAGVPAGRVAVGTGVEVTEPVQLARNHCRSASDWYSVPAIAAQSRLWGTGVAVGVGKGVDVASGTTVRLTGLVAVAATRALPPEPPSSMTSAANSVAPKAPRNRTSVIATTRSSGVMAVRG
jgi:hypothetical protein